jgi:tetratricopeptide (TPR) repeat protein
MRLFSRDKLKMDCNRGNQYLEQGRIEAAQAEFQAALDLDSNSVDAHYGLARCYYRAWLSANIAIDDGSLQNFFIPSDEVQAILRLPERAIKEYELVLRLQPNLAEAHAELGDLYLTRDPEKSIQYWQTALRLDPGCALANWCLGNVDMKDGRIEEAIAKYRKGVQRDNTKHRYWFALGQAYYESSNALQAISAFKKAVELKPDYADALYNLGTAYLNIGKKAEAMAAYRKFLRLEPNSLYAMSLLEKFPELRG